MMDAGHRRYDLFARLSPHQQGMLDVGDGHEIYWEVSGNPDGQPALFLHGGPGAGAGPVHRRFFDPAHYRIVVFDQRGAGRSTPHAETRDNTTPKLIKDIECLRRHLGVKKWLVFGGSWGSTLALCYAIEHAERCTGLILRGIFLGAKAEVDWFLYGIRTVFPEVWRQFSGYIPEPEQGDLQAAYHARLMDPDPGVHMPAARVWSRFEHACSTLLGGDPGDITRPGGPAEDRAALPLSRLEVHYFVNDMFLPENHILDNLEAVRAIPTVIVQGRYDAVCPPKTADLLAGNLPAARYVVVPDAGHSALEPGVRSALVEATESLKSGA